jgi:UDP-glucose 4-epimerase
MKYILCTGGLGFIGSHTVTELVNIGYNVLILDDFSNSNNTVLNKLSKICDASKIKFIEGNILNNNHLDLVFQNEISCVIHFAAFKSVNESIDFPLKYYENNVTGTINLLKKCEQYNVNKFVFSSSATVYGSSKSPLNENSQVGIGITNPYGKSKYIVEQILKDLKHFKVINLRYFNPVGAHKSGLIGEDPSNIPNNLMPFVLRVAIKNNLDPTYDNVYEKLSIFGNNYNSKDGTAVRDFIHVVDLAKAHVCAVNKILEMKSNFEIYNIGTGNGTSVLEIVNTFKNVNNIKLPFEFKPKREGDNDIVYCETNKANNELNWKAMLNIEDICRDTYNFALKNNL